VGAKIYFNERNSKPRDLSFPGAPSCLARPRRDGRDLVRHRLGGVRGPPTDGGVRLRAAAAGTGAEIASAGITAVAAATEAEIAAVGKGGAGDAEAGVADTAEGAGTAAEETGLPARLGAPRMIPGTRSSAPSR
jgi:hypothetical protein